MSLVHGKNVIVYIDDGGESKPYACARSCTLTTVTDTIDVSVKGSGKWRSIEPTINSFSGNIDGLNNLGINSTLSLPDLRKKQLAQDKLRMWFTKEDLDGTVYSEEGDFYITNISDTSSFDNINTFTIEIQGTGALVQLFCPIPQNVQVSDITNNSATVTWNNYGNALGYVVLVNGASQAGGPSPRVLVGLDGDTEYTISVTTQCEGVLGSSPESEEVIFTTL